MSKVSIIVPLYNKAPYITKALESVKAQTFTDWECIIVNDGSTDNSPEIVASWLASNPSISSADSSKCNSIKQVPCPSIRLVHQENAGVSAARNHGISLSTGEYITFLDADDWWSPTFLEEMLHLVERYPDAGIYGCDYYRVKNGKLLTYPKRASGYINYYKVYTRSGAMPLHPDGVLVPRHVIEDLRLKNKEWFPCDIRMGEDFFFFMKIVSQYKVAYLDKQLVYFNQDADATNRATTKLHDPSCHMLWNLHSYEELERTNTDYKAMIDFLRVFSLGTYLQSPEYHGAAVAEMAKVSRWNKLRFTLKRYWMKIDNKLKQL